MNGSDASSDSHRQAEGNDTRTRALLLGAVTGAICGLVGGMLYARAADEYDRAHPDEPRTISTGQLLGALLSILAVIRQVAELGKPKKPGKK